MKKEPAHKLEELVVKWKRIRGISKKTRSEAALKQLISETETWITHHEKLGCLLMPTTQPDGSIKFIPLADAKEALKQFKKLFDLE